MMRGLAHTLADILDVLAETTWRALADDFAQLVGVAFIFAAGAALAIGLAPDLFLP